LTADLDDVNAGEFRSVETDALLRGETIRAAWRGAPV